MQHIRENHPDVEIMVGLDWRGLLFNRILATELGVSCAPIRKKGKLPGEVASVEYQLEYGSVSKLNLKPIINHRTLINLITLHRIPLRSN